jgi:nickel-dependent lactate racemase
MILFEKGSPTADLSADDLREGICSSLDKIGPPRNMLIVPPDITRLQSRAGDLTRFAYEHRPEAVSAILPALGTHCPMSIKEIQTMFGKTPPELFLPHSWRTDCDTSGAVPSDFVASVSENIVDYQIPVCLNRRIFNPEYDCILSISQVVPHEVAGMAGYNKNIIVGLAGPETIHKTHFLGAAFGMERIMGNPDSPVRKVFAYVQEKSLDRLPIVHVITVVAMDTSGASGALKVRGLFVGDDKECFSRAANLSRSVNIYALDKPLKKVVVHLDPVEYKSTWLGNKSIYRTRMAIADGGELIVVAPGVKMFGEDAEIDRLVRQFGYKGTPAVMRNIKTDERLKNNLSAAAHLIHGSSEGRFSITYCPGKLTQQEIENVGLRFAPVEEMLRRYDPSVMKEGASTLASGEEVFFISNPGIGLWAWKDKFR